jgi:hypothetical protein
LFVSNKTLPQAAKLITIKNQKNYEKDFTFLVLVAIGGKLRNAKKPHPRPLSKGEGSSARVLQWQ